MLYISHPEAYWLLVSFHKLDPMCKPVGKCCKSKKYDDVILACFICPYNLLSERSFITSLQTAVKWRMTAEVEVMKSREAPLFNAIAILKIVLSFLIV